MVETNEDNKEVKDAMVNFDNVPIESRTWNHLRCTKCGDDVDKVFDENDVVLCGDIYMLVEKMFPTSHIIKSWDDVATKCHTVLCLNNAEYKTGLQTGDMIIEETESYHLIEEENKQGLLLIVIHDSNEQNHLLEEQILHKVLKQGKLQTLEELQKSKHYSTTEVKEEEKCKECHGCE